MRARAPFDVVSADVNRLLNRGIQATVPAYKDGDAARVQQLADFYSESAILVIEAHGWTAEDYRTALVLGDPMRYN